MSSARILRLKSGLEEAAKYLNIREKELLHFTEGASINLIRINEKYMFSKEVLNKWAQSDRLGMHR